MSYTLDESLSSPNFTPGALCPAAFGYPRTIIGCTIHHWDEKAKHPTWDGAINTLMNDYRNPGSRGVSAHFVAETGRVACLVSVADAAWHAGNPMGNAQTVGIECNADESDGTYQTVAELLARVWLDWGIPHDLFAHNYWTGTDCPGDYDLVRLRSMAEDEFWALTHPTPPAPTPIKEDTLSAAEVNQIVTEIKASEKRTQDYVAALLVKQWSIGGVTYPGVWQVVAENQRRINTANNALAQLLTPPGSVPPVDPTTPKVG